jgi:hypothetical protein
VLQNTSYCILSSLDASSIYRYKSKLVYAKPTRGLYEIEPSAAWNPTVICGVGVVEDVDQLYNDMHTYLATSGGL